ncbi:hypothetical protein [Streptomyces sp. AS02]|uniref:hypothetical protein n=1 Tax=Streptomyces sp. AS02 TaxID=2938946 RepID=UPI002021C468|nr:hypothetical protein [Streptomyces sp. AS02]MCL8016639.1 hypothetical protein [Streptomyces sp. AS02]
MPAPAIPFLGFLTGSLRSNPGVDLERQPVKGDGMSILGDAYCFVEDERGERYDNPSEDLLFELIGELDSHDNGSFVVEPVDDSASWYVSVSLLDSGEFETVYRCSSRGEHRVVVSGSPAEISYDVTVWIAGLPSSLKPTRTQN